MKKNNICNWLNLNKSLIFSVYVIIVGDIKISYAENYFNPAFLSDDSNAVADLSRFSKSDAQAPGKYRVDVYLNGLYKESSDIYFEPTEDVENQQKNTSSSKVTLDDTGLIPCLSSGYLASLGININAFLKENKNLDPKSDDSQKCVNLSFIPSVTTEFDFEKQRLDLSFPQAMLSNLARGYVPPEQWDNGINAFLMNYTFTGSNSKDNTVSGASENSYFLGLNGGLNWGAWRLRNYTTWNKNSGSQSDWQHINTYLQRAIIPINSQLTIGDSYTPSDIFDSLSFRGVQLSSDDNMLPDSLRGFAPTVRGIAKSNAQVTIKQNGYTIYQTYVSPGPFTIDDLYPTSSSGDLQVEVKETDGSVNSYSLPYSSVPVLQREGRIKHAFTLAKFRSNGSYQDDVGFFQGTLIWGLPKGWTLFGGSQQSANYSSYNIGAGINIGEWGALSTDITFADSTLVDQSKHNGQSVRFLYAKSLNDLGTNFQLLGYRYSTSGFYSLDETAYKHMDGHKSESSDTNSQTDTPEWMDYYNLYYTKRGKLQVNITQQIAKGMGSVYLTASQQSYWHTDETESLLQLGYNNTWHDFNYSISYSYNKAVGQPEADQVFALNISIPLSKWLSNSSGLSSANNNAFATYNINTDKHGQTTQNAGLSGTALEDHNLNYSIQQGYANHGVGANGNMNINYLGTYGNVTSGYSYNDNGDYQQVNYGIAGGVVAHSEGITFSQPLGDTNVLIKIPGASGVEVENSTGVKTDWRGYTVVPYASAYKSNRMAINMSSLAEDVDVEDAVVDIVPTQGAVVKASFDAHVGQRVLFKLTHAGRSLPFGSIVSVEGDSRGSIVGDDGEVYLSGLNSTGRLNANWGDGDNEKCTVLYKIKDTSKSIIRQNAECE